MYFLKKQGNIAVHSENSSNSGKIALECLEHAFEAAVNYAYALTHNDKINRLIFDEQLLVTGEKNTSLQEEYTKNCRNINRKTNTEKKKKKNTKENISIQTNKKKTKNQKVLKNKTFFPL